MFQYRWYCCINVSLKIPNDHENDDKNYRGQFGGHPVDLRHNDDDDVDDDSNNNNKKCVLWNDGSILLPNNFCYV